MRKIAIQFIFVAGMVLFLGACRDPLGLRPWLLNNVSGATFVTTGRTNVAVGKTAGAFFMDGSAAVSNAGGSPVIAGLGIDGDINTWSTQPYGQYRWYFEVDLGTSFSVDRMRILFAPWGWATRFELGISADGMNWKTTEVDYAKTVDEEWVHTTFDPVEGRFIRITVIKPDGAGQVGGQMVIRELEVYEAQ